LLACLGDYGAPEAPIPFIAPHGIAIDSQHSIYLAELSYAVMGKKAPLGKGQPLVTLQKLSLVPERS